MFEGADSCL
jgi:hypothetical protein